MCDFLSSCQQTFLVLFSASFDMDFNADSGLFSSMITDESAEQTSQNPEQPTDIRTQTGLEAMEVRRREFPSFELLLFVFSSSQHKTNLISTMKLSLLIRRTFTLEV